MLPGIAIKFDLTLSCDIRELDIITPFLDPLKGAVITYPITYG